MSSLFAVRSSRSLRCAALFAMMFAMSACGGGGGGSTASVPPIASVQAPVIATQPAPQSVAVGQSATFSVGATGDGLGYQWQRNGADIAGATAATYVLNNAQASDDGSRFTVVVRNAGGSATSAAATLQVKSGQLSLLAGAIGGPGDMDGPVGRFLEPTNIAAGPSGELWVNDFSTTSGLRKITQLAGAAATVSSPPRTDPWVVRIGAIDAAGNRYENWWTAIHKTTPAGVRTLLAGNPNGPGTADGAGIAAGFGGIAGMAVDTGGTVYVADYLNATIRKISPEGVVSTLAGSAGQTGTQDGAGAAARFRKPMALALDKAGNVYVDDDTVVRKITPAGVVSTMATVPRWPPAPNDFFPQIPVPSVLTPVWGGLAVGADGSVFVLSGNIRRVSPEGVVTNFAGSAYTWGKYSSMTQDAAGNMYVVDREQTAIFRITPAGDISIIAGQPDHTGYADGTGAEARFEPTVSDMVVDAQGNVLFAESSRVRKVSAGGVATTLSLPPTDGKGNPTVYLLSGMAYGGDMLVYAGGTLSRLDSNGKPADTIAAVTGRGVVDGARGVASMAFPVFLRVDPKGNIYFRDYVWPPSSSNTPVPTIYNRRIGPDGAITTLAGTDPVFGDNVTWDRDGNLIFTTAAGIQKRAPDGAVATLYARPGDLDPAALNGPIAVDRNGNVYIASNNVLRKFTPAGAMSILAGARAASASDWARCRAVSTGSPRWRSAVTAPSTSKARTRF